MPNQTKSIELEKIHEIYQQYNQQSLLKRTESKKDKIIKNNHITNWRGLRQIMTQIESTRKPYEFKLEEKMEPIHEYKTKDNKTLEEQLPRFL